MKTKLRVFFWHQLHRLFNFFAWRFAVVAGQPNREHFLWRLNDWAAYKYILGRKIVQAIIEQIAMENGFACQYDDQGTLVAVSGFEEDDTTQVDPEDDTQPNLKIP